MLWLYSAVTKMNPSSDSIFSAQRCPTSFFAGDKNGSS
jgi:hypothetical protein